MTPIEAGWSWEPLAVVPLVLVAILYVKGLIAVARHRDRALCHNVPALQIASFVLGWLALAAAIDSPIDTLASSLFSAHMVQHELLMIVAAPLLVLARPARVFLAALPERSRNPIGRLPHGVSVLSRRVASFDLWRAVTGPLVASLLHGAALWIWHLPVLYQAALGSDGVHAVEHACFFGTAVLFWSALVHGRFGRLGYGASLVYVFATSLHSNLLGALLTITPRVWYPAYGNGARSWGLTPLEDQQLAGLVMWVPASIVFVVLGLALLAAWIGESERRVAYSASERMARGAASKC